MSTLPTILANGVVAIYGVGGYISASGVIPNGETDFRFGLINKVYAGGSVFVYDNDEVMFRDADVITRVLYNDYPYTLIPARLVTKQEPPPP